MSTAQPSSPPAPPRALQDRFARLERQRAAVFSRLDGLDDERLNRQPEGGGWSATQVMSHLITAEKTTLDGVRKRMERAGHLRKAGLVSALKSNLLAFVLRLPVRIKAPSGVAQVPERQDLETTRRLWDEVRTGWKELIDTVPAELAGQAVSRHPVAGDINIHQTLRFLENHFNRHAKQIDRVLSEA